MKPIAFTLSETSFVETARAHNRTKWPRFVAVYVVVSAILGLIITGFADGWSVEGPFWADCIWMVSMMIGVAVTMSILMFVLTQYMMIPRRVRRALTHFDTTALQQSVDWDDENFRLSSEEGSSSVRFARLAGWKSVAGYLLIYRTDDYYNIIPVAALGDDGDTLLQKLGAAGVKPR